jgi:hypothetical protein
MPPSLPATPPKARKDPRSEWLRHVTAKRLTVGRARPTLRSLFARRGGQDFSAQSIMTHFPRPAPAPGGIGVPWDAARSLSEGQDDSHARTNPAWTR